MTSLLEFIRLDVAFYLIITIVGVTSGYLSCVNDKDDIPTRGFKWGSLAGFYFILGLFIISTLLRLQGDFLIFLFINIFLLIGLFFSALGGMFSRLIHLFIINARSLNYEKQRNFTMKNISIFMLFLMLTIGTFYSLMVKYEDFNVETAIISPEGWIFITFFQVMNIFFYTSFAVYLLSIIIKNVLNYVHQKDFGENYIYIVIIFICMLIIIWTFRFMDQNADDKFFSIISGEIKKRMQVSFTFVNQIIYYAMPMLFIHLVTLLGFSYYIEPLEDTL
ncbi:MAG: hypothetical protein ACXAC7_08560 [Candidatus Hodarchaeales archaeon]